MLTLKHFIEACFIAGGWLILSIVAGLLCGAVIRAGVVALLAGVLSVIDGAVAIWKGRK